MNDELPRVYIDANVFIRMTESDDEVMLQLKSVFASFEAGLATAATSEITVAEILVNPFEESDRKRIDAYLAMISSSDALRVVPVGREILVQAAELRARDSSLKLPDAIHLATAEMSDCGIFLSDDKRIRPRTPMRRVGFAAQELEALRNFLA